MDSLSKEQIKQIRHKTQQEQSEQPKLSTGKLQSLTKQKGIHNSTSKNRMAPKVKDTVTKLKSKHFTLKRNEIRKENEQNKLKMKWF